MFDLRDKQLADRIVRQIQETHVALRFMHVCGTHQETLVRHGLDILLKGCGITITQGPGCPVCVTTAREVEEAIALARHGCTVASFGDMLQVPGATVSLQHLKTEGRDVRTVYSIEDAISMARGMPSREVVFLAVGFETTAPSTGAVMLADPPENFSILCCHRTMPAALDAILDMGEIKIDGFIEPGHVSTIIGQHPYEFISERYHIPQVIAGFEPLDVLMAAWMLVQQVVRGDASVENEYTRAVRPEGNLKAQEVLRTVFDPADIAWRGFPVIPGSGLKLKKRYEHHDARIKFADALLDLSSKTFAGPAGCRCGDVLRGTCSSQDCPLFGCRCTPQSPLGPCMVSREGSCRIEYQFHKK